VSADNYFHIRRDGDQYVVAMGFMSDDYAPGAPPPSADDRRFGSLAEAEDYADGEYSEYGVRVEDQP